MCVLYRSWRLCVCVCYTDHHGVCVIPIMAAAGQRKESVAGVARSADGQARSSAGGAVVVRLWQGLREHSSRNSQRLPEKPVSAGQVQVYAG